MIARMVRRFLFALGALILLCVVGVGAVVLFHQRGMRQAQKEWDQDRPGRVLNFGSVKALRVLPLVNWHVAGDSGGRLRGEVGVSYLIQTDSARILFDLGQNAKNESPSPLEANMLALGIHREEIDAIFISHLHFDHVGGRRWSGDRSFSFGVRQDPLPGMNVFTPVAMSYPGLETRHTPKARALMAGVATTGTIPRQLMIGRIDEQALVIHLAGKGLVVIVGCGHQTLAKLIARVERVFREPIYGIIGDLHYPVPEGRLDFLGLNGQRLFASGDGIWRPLRESDVQKDIELLQERAPGVVALGGHDSSDESITRFAQAFGDRYRRVRVGEWIEVR